MKSVQLRDHVYQALKELQAALGAQTISDVVETALKLVRAIMRLTHQWRELLSLPEDLIAEHLRRLASAYTPQAQVIYVMPMPYPTFMPSPMSQGQQFMPQAPHYQEALQPMRQYVPQQLRKSPGQSLDQTPY